MKGYLGWDLKQSKKPWVTQTKIVVGVRENDALNEENIMCQDQQWRIRH